MTTLPNMGIILPTPGGDSGSWDDKINAGFGRVDAHDHTPGNGLQVPTAGLDIDADLAFGGWGITGLGKAAFNAVAALAAGSKTLFVSVADNELYWRTNAGVNVKLTSGTSINTTLVGGIVGDYSTVGAEVAFDDANKRYTFKDQAATKKWARLASGPVRIHEYNTNESVYVELAVAAALAASYTVTWPAALPTASSVVQISAAGVVSFASDVTIPGVYYFNGDESLSIPLGQTIDPAGSHTIAYSQILFSVALDPVYFPLSLPVGAVITGYRVEFQDNTANDLALDVVSNYRGGADTVVDAGNLSSNIGGGSAGNLVAEVAAGTGTCEIQAGTCYHLRATPNADISTSRIHAVEIYWTKPAP